MNSVMVAGTSKITLLSALALTFGVLAHGFCRGSAEFLGLGFPGLLCRVKGLGFALDC